MGPADFLELKNFADLVKLTNFTEYQTHGGKTKVLEKFVLPVTRGFKLTETRRDPCPSANPHL